MKKGTTKRRDGRHQEMRSEYDFTHGVRGKHYRAMQAGYTIIVRRADGTTLRKHVRPTRGAVVLDPDVERFFPDSDSVNTALRSLIRLIPKPKGRTAAGDGARATVARNRLHT